jgi:CheY-like chemotaxis protein
VKISPVRNRTAEEAVSLDWALSARNPSVFKIQRTSFIHRRQAFGLAVKATLMSVSVENGAQALVVLVVEDEFFVRYDVADCLRAAGYVVVETESGDEAIDLCKSDMSIDIVFTDINLTGAASGWDVAEHFRTDRPTVPVLYTSAKSIDPRRCVTGSAFVAKPYQHDDILNACQRLRTK